MAEVAVVIVGAGPAGLATSACLNHLNISNIVLEREDCYASLWRKRAYDRLHLHLAKEFCELPRMPFPSDCPTFVPRKDFVSYLENYASEFEIRPLYYRSVWTASYDQDHGKWFIQAKNMASNVNETYVARFLVVATGQNSEGVVPQVPGIDSFGGELMHSNNYANGMKYRGKNVLVVGCGNSGMEISYDLTNWGVNTSIVVRNPVHLITREHLYIAMCLLKYLPSNIVDMIAVVLSKLRYGDTSKYGIRRPSKGPLYLKAETGRTPTIDVGAMDKIKEGEIQVFPEIKNINGNEIEFVNGKVDRFDAIIFATGYRSTVTNWLKGGEDLFNDMGMPRSRFPNHWKGKDGLYCVGFAPKGLQGISIDAQNIANDISAALKHE